MPLACMCMHVLHARDEWHNRHVMCALCHLAGLTIDSLLHSGERKKESARMAPFNMCTGCNAVEVRSLLSLQCSRMSLVPCLSDNGCALCCACGGLALIPVPISALPTKPCPLWLAVVHAVNCTGCTGCSAALPAGARLRWLLCTSCCRAFADMYALSMRSKPRTNRSHTLPLTLALRCGVVHAIAVLLLLPRR